MPKSPKENLDDLSGIPSQIFRPLVHHFRARLPPARRFLAFFAATIRNKNTRVAYYRAATRFFARCDHHTIGEIT
jgi:hypothetical protein